MAFQIGENISLITAVTKAGEAIDPALVKINIIQPNGNLVVESGSVSKIEVGSYNYDYIAPAGVLGTYRYNIVATGGEGRVTIAKGSFLIEDPLK